MELSSRRDADAFKLVVLPSALVSGLFSIVRFPGLTDECAVMFRVFSAAFHICNVLLYRTHDTAKQSSTFARLALLFHACTCFLAAQGSLFNLVLWIAHAGLEIVYTWLFHCLTVRRKSPLPHMCFLVVCLSSGGALRLLRLGQVFESPQAHPRRLEGDDETIMSSSTGILIVTMISLVVGGLVVYGACRLERVNQHPTLFYAMQSLRSSCSLIWRRSTSCLDGLRQCFRTTNDDVCELDDNGISEDALGDACEPNPRKVADPVPHNGEDEPPTNTEDIIFNIVEPQAIGRSSMEAPDEQHVGQTNQEQVRGLDVLPPVHGSLDDAVARDPMDAVEELEHGLMYNAQAAITFSDGGHTGTSWSSDNSESSEQ
eukprot:TRINITY_DN74400_c0_g1_i1.p1 TRINITY_DN74400_c0_g1~~TRINITY_DN74400_c0_g1_i1.p1  ORF type:complete len:372 (+),score=30.30 TRINITY_DN74400_c0_g1_i1:39-1154(+)